MNARRGFLCRAGVYRLLAIAVLGWHSGWCAPLEPVFKEAGWEEGSAVLERWLAVQGLTRTPLEVFPQQSEQEVFSGDGKARIKVRVVRTANAQGRLVVDLPDGKRYGEIYGAFGDWHVSEMLGIGRLSAPSDLSKLVRPPAITPATVRSQYRAWRRFPDQEMDGKKVQIVGLLHTHGALEYWWFDPDSGVRVMTDVMMTNGKLAERTRFRDFRTVDGTLEAHEMIIERGHRTVVQTKSLQNRVSLPNRFFELTKDETAKWQKTEDILQKYVKACGGFLALSQIVSRVTKSVGQHVAAATTFELTVTQKSPHFYLAENSVAGLGRTWQGFDGESGWELSELKGFRPVRGVEREFLRRSGQLNAEHFPKLFPFRQALGVWEMKGRKVAGLALATLEGKAGTYFFDLESGQLVRLELPPPEEVEGALPISVDYSDFRTVDGVTIPFHSVVFNPPLRTVLQIESVKHNVELDEAIFRPRKEE
jgi:hypothetical protein